MLNSLLRSFGVVGRGESASRKPSNTVEDLLSSGPVKNLLAQLLEEFTKATERGRRTSSKREVSSSQFDSELDEPFSKRQRSPRGVQEPVARRVSLGAEAEAARREASGRSWQKQFILERWVCHPVGGKYYERCRSLVNRAM